jgi:predicted small metal-binding protein
MGLSCPFVVKGETMDEVIYLALDHVREAHQDQFNLIVTPEQVEKMKKALARSTRVVAG